jgi:hypothetical protein
MFKFQESFAKCKWVIMCMAYEQNCVLWYKKLKFQIISMIWNYDNFPKWNVIFGKICTLLENSYSFKNN